MVRFDLGQPAFQMLVHNILRKPEILETNPKSKEIINFYVVCLYIFGRTTIFCFHKFYFLFVDLFN